MTRGELARATGCNGETIRYYERAGLLPDPPRTAGGHRVYGPEHRRRLGFVLRGRALGFSLEDLRTLLSLVDRGDYSCADVQGISQRHLAEIRAKQADLARLERTLADLVSACESGQVPDCPILESLWPDRPAGRA